MTVESATYISDLNAANPGATDLKSEGDDHMRLIKSVLKSTFPNITGAVTATQATLNATYLPLSGGTVTGDVSFNGNTTLGDASGDTVTVNASTASAPNGLTFSGGSVNYAGAASYSVGSTSLRAGTTAGFPVCVWNYAGGGADSKLWDAYVDGTTWHMRVINDADNAFSDAITVVRSGTTVTQINLNPTTLLYNGKEVGTRGITQRNISGSDTPTAADAGKMIIQSGAGNITINNGVFPSEAVFFIYNNTASPFTIVQGAGATLRLDGTSLTGNRVVGAWAKAGLYSINGTVFSVSGAGVS